MDYKLTPIIVSDRRDPVPPRQAPQDDPLAQQVHRSVFLGKQIGRAHV